MRFLSMSVWQYDSEISGAGIPSGVNMIISGSMPTILIRYNRSVISNKHNCHLLLSAAMSSIPNIYNIWSVRGCTGSIQCQY